MNIIYIDDDSSNRFVVREMLSTAGLAVTEADSAHAGLGLIERGSFDLVLMDIRMPEVSGLTAIRQLRAREKDGQRVPIVVTTADLTPGVREMCRQAGATDFLVKPISMDGLFDAIAAVMVERNGALLV